MLFASLSPLAVFLVLSLAAWFYLFIVSLVAAVNPYYGQWRQFRYTATCAFLMFVFTIFVLYTLS